MRVLFVASSGQLGGAELALLTYLEHLPTGLDGHGLILSPGPVGELMEERLGRPVATAGLTGRPSVLAAAQFATWLAGVLRKVRPDIVLATGIKAAALCAPVCRVLRVPLIWHKVDLSHDSWLAGPLALVTSGVVPVSTFAGASVPRSRRLTPIPPPVRLDPDFRVRPERPYATLGSVGRLVPYKGHSDVIEAAALIPGARVLIAGADDRSAPGHRQDLLSLAAARRVEVEVLGHTNCVEMVYERLTVLVQATYRDERGIGLEGFGMAVAEASWAGLPVVATAGGAAAYATCIVPERDPAAIAAAVIEIVEERAAAARPEASVLAPAEPSEASHRARAELGPEALTAALVSVLRGFCARASASRR